MKKDFWNMVNNRQKISVNLMTERRVRIEQVDNKDIIVLEAFVFAPRYDKRQYLRQVESLLYSFEWEDESK